MIKIDIDDIILEKAEDTLMDIPKAAPKAVSAALNRAASGSKTETSKKIREVYTIRARDINKTIRITRSTPSDLRAIIRSTGSPLALSTFKFTPNKNPGKKGARPVKAKVMKSSGGFIKGSFMARMKSGHVGIFRRTSIRSFPIVERYGPSVPQMMDNESVMDYVEQRTLERFENRLEHEIDRILRGIGR